MSGALIPPRLPPRYLIKLPVLCKPKSPLSTRAGIGWTRNVSERGACVELADVLPPGMPICLCLHTDRGVIEAESLVAWSKDLRQEEGGILHGFAFTRLSASHMPILADLLLFKRKMREGGVRLPLDIAVTCEPDGLAESVSGRTTNLSRGGLLLRLHRRLPAMTALRLTLHAPTGPLRGKGLVVWTETVDTLQAGAPIPHGLRFTCLSWSSCMTLGLLLMAPSYQIAW